MSHVMRSHIYESDKDGLVFNKDMRYGKLFLGYSF